MKNKKTKFDRYSIGFRRATTISILIVGAIIISATIAAVQTNSAKDRQRVNGINALNEITSTLQNNDDTIENITFEYNKLNQNTTESLCEFANNSDLFRPIIEEEDQEVRQNMINSTSNSLSELQKDLDTGTIGVVDSQGNIFLCSNINYINKNLIEFNIDEEKINNLFQYEPSKGINGTEIINDGIPTFCPVSVISDGEDFYMYSSHLYSTENENYFLLLNISNKLLETEMAGIDQIGNVLNSLSLGKDGFFLLLTQKLKNLLILIIMGNN